MKKLLLSLAFLASLIGCSATPKAPCETCVELKQRIFELGDRTLKLENELLQLGVELADVDSNLHSLARDQVRVQLNFEDDVTRVLAKNGWLPPEEAPHQHDDKCEGND